MKLAKGVNLHVINETKFKTIHVMVRFRELVSRKGVAKRTLLGSLFETSSAKYPRPKDLQAAFAHLYGASLACSTQVKGRQHFLTFSMNLVDSHLVGEDILNPAVALLKELIFAPNIVNNQFEPETFDLEKGNLLNYLDSIRQDHDYYAALRLEELFYSDVDQASSAAARRELVEKLNAAELYSYYQQMLAQDTVDIFVLGAVDETAVTALFADWSLGDREALQEIFYRQDLYELTELVEAEKAYQSVLAMAWTFPTRYGDKEFMALQVMNGIFGGLPHSKLFTVVRERESLAYGIGSIPYSFTGMLKVSAGIEAEDFEHTKSLVLELLEAVKAGDFTDEDFQQTKDMLRNAYFIAKDSPSVLLEEAFLRTILPDRTLTADEWVSGLEAVTREEVMAAAKALTLQTIYLFKGIGESEEA